LHHDLQFQIIFANKGFRSRLQSRFLKQPGTILLGADQDDPHPGHQSDQLRRAREAILAWQIYIHDGKIRLQVPRSFFCLEQVAGFPNDQQACVRQ
jgi:hypothetical protein